MGFGLLQSSGQSGNCFRSFAALRCGREPLSETGPVDGNLMSSGNLPSENRFPVGVFPSGSFSRTGPPDGSFRTFVPIRPGIAPFQKRNSGMKRFPSGGSPQGFHLSEFSTRPCDFSHGGFR